MECRGSKQRGAGVNEPTARQLCDLAVKRATAVSLHVTLFFNPHHHSGTRVGCWEEELGKWHTHRHEGKKKHLLVEAWHRLLVSARLLKYYD